MLSRGWRRRSELGTRQDPAPEALAGRPYCPPYTPARPTTIGPRIAPPHTGDRRRWREAPPARRAAGGTAPPARGAAGRTASRRATNPLTRTSRIARYTSMNRVGSGYQAEPTCAGGAGSSRTTGVTNQRGVARSVRRVVGAEVWMTGDMDRLLRRWILGAIRTMSQGAAAAAMRRAPVREGTVPTADVRPPPPLSRRARTAPAARSRARCGAPGRAGRG